MSASKSSVAISKALTRFGLPSDLRDIMDTANDMLFGIVGAAVFVLVYKGTEWYQLKRAHPKQARPGRS